MNQQISQFRIIGLAPNNWHYIWMNRQQILSRLGRNHPIVYSNGPHFFYDRHGDNYRKAPLLSGIELSDHVAIDIPGKFPARWPRIPLFDRSAIRLSVKRWIRYLASFPKGPLVAYLFHPNYLPYLKHIPADLVVYHAYDLFRLAPGWSDRMAQDELALLHQADLAFGSSRAIADELAERSGRNVKHLPNGVDFEMFQAESSMPNDIVNIPSPRIGYVGRITNKLNFELLHHLANARQDWNIVMVGPIEKLDPAQQANLDSCKACQNIHFLGGRKRELIPAYVNHLDVGLMPYRTDGLWTDAIYPLKLHEYLAAGLPIVSSAIRTMMDYPDLVQIASSTDEWLNQVQNMIKPSSVAKIAARKDLARQHSWDAITAGLEKTIESSIRDRTPI